MIRIRNSFILTLVLLGVYSCALGQPRQLDDYRWEGVKRVVAIGDLHGDEAQYRKVMESAGLINSRGKWTGGETHLVQTGDITDRGADSRAIIDHLQGLKKQAEKKGGRVHTLIGNHEAMNSYGDLRYVHAGEFAAFQSRNSEKIREQQWQFQLNRIKQTKPEMFLTMNLDEYRKEWEQKIPLGWVEHRLAWSPDGEYGKQILESPLVLMINGTLFLHGGLGPEYCRYSLNQMTDMAHEQLQSYDPLETGILNDENGPVWYRGLATENENTFDDQLDQILERYGASRIVVGHTPTGGVVWPRFDGKVIVNDTGIAAYYGGNDAYLELQGDAAMAGYGERKLALPSTREARLDYLRQVVAFKPDNKELQELLRQQEAALDLEATPAEAGTESEAVSPGICLSASD